MKVKIFGAGSIGNHLAQASRRKEWDVTVVDIDQSALNRMREEIYPARYGSWDDEIKLFTPDTAPKGGFDIIMIGTPPNVRMEVALEALKEQSKVIQLEKPFFVPVIDDSSSSQMEQFLTEAKKYDVKIVVGYEYALGVSAVKIAEYIKQNDLGQIRLLELSVREEWSGIFAAHPWLAGPHESYLGFWQKGGGACSEHSHAIHYWQHFADLLNLGKINTVSASMKMGGDNQGHKFNLETDIGLDATVPFPTQANTKLEYDEVTYLNLTTNSGFKGRIVQDVVTDPPYLSMLIQGKLGFVKWLRRAVPGKGNVETIEYGKKDEQGQWQTAREDIVVKRPDDFYPEICHIDDLLNNRITIEDSPINLDSGVLSTKVVTAAHKSRLNNGNIINV